MKDNFNVVASRESSVSDIFSHSSYIMSTEIKNLTQLLQSSLGKNEHILDYSSYSIVPAGENYGGVILAVDVTIYNGTSKEIRHFVAKLKPQNEMLGVMFNIQNTFKREMDLYVEIIPMLINFQKEFNINNTLDCFPKCYEARLNINDKNIVDDDGLILFENLKTQGYEMENRMIGFDLEHSSLIIKNLARFHAVPIALKLLKPDVYNLKIASLVPYSFGDSFTSEMQQNFCKELFDIVNEIEECKNYASKIVDLVDKGFKFEERFIEPKGQYLTVVHHDLWANNVMVLRNQSYQPLKIKLYDLQMASYGSLAHDLIFFLFSSVQQNVFNNYYDNLIKLYYDSFIECLKEFKLNTESFTWTSFINEINIIGPHQISHIIIMMRPIFMEKNKVQDMADMDENEMSALRALNSRYLTKLHDCILAFVDRKWL